MAPSARPILFCANVAWNLANFRGPIIASLLADGRRVIAAAASDGSEAQLVAMGAEFRPLPVAATSRNPLADLRLLVALIRLLKWERPAAVLSFTIKPNIYAPLAARLTGTRAIATISGLGSAFLAGGPTGRLIDRLYQIGLAGADAVFFQNCDDRDLFLDRKLVRRPQVRLVAGSGIDLERFRPAPLPAGNRPVFLFIGRLLKDKGILEFVEAARRVRAGGIDADFQLLGECGVDNPSAVPISNVERWVADGIVRHLGATDDVRAQIARSDCVVLPSYREGVPRSLLEAAAMGRPLIATDVPGCRDVIEQGRNGYLCAARSSASLADAIAKVARLGAAERERMGRESRAKVEREFSVERVIDAYRSELGL